MVKNKIVMYLVNNGYMIGIDYHMETVVTMGTNNVSKLCRLHYE